MRFDNRHIFTGKINGQALNEFKKFDYTLHSIEDRLKYVNDKIEDSVDETGLNFFENYVYKHYKDKLNGNDELSEGHAVFKALENSANYLLGAAEIREMRKNDVQQYRYYVDESEFRLRTQREQLFENLVGEGEGNSDNVIHFLLNTNSENFLLQSNPTVTSKDIKGDDFCGEVLRQYSELLRHVDTQIKNPDEKYKGKRYIMTKTKRELLSDMLYTKLAYKKNIKFTHVCKGTSETDWDCFDWSVHSHVKELIYVQSGFHPENDLSFILLDLENLVKEMVKSGKITKSEHKVYKLVRQGYKNNEIAEILGVRRTYISNTVAVAVKKISNYASSKCW